MKKIILVPFILIATIAFSQERTARADVRQTSQQTRIAQGHASGELTRHETRSLRTEQRHIRRSERRVKADGDVTVAERRRLDRRQDRANRHIRRAKNNQIDKN
ncbi:MAG TPA: hypothetical protein VK508_18925 [Cyclobacteriaceae bacterium]|nr:hypothetical protein [Cyclobacteriaceae bacterium]